jgi:Ca2+-binding RTX toxin-like protein
VVRRIVLLLASMVLAVLLASGVVWAATVECKPGSTAENPCQGTPSADTLYGTEGPDYILGLKGIDQVQGFDGDDSLHGGFTNDRWVRGGLGNDRVFGEEGGDLALRGGPGHDRVSGGVGNDKNIKGDLGRDVLLGGAGDDNIDGFNDGFGFHVDDGRHDSLFGGAGDDLLIDSAGVATVEGGDGNDRIIVTDTGEISGRDSVACGEGNDSVSADSNDRVRADCERVTRS